MTLGSYHISESEQQIIDNLHLFIDREILPLEAEIWHILDNPRLQFDENGKENALITEARKTARMRAAKAGFYTMFCPKEFGGEDLGIRLWFLCWESLFHRFGPPQTRLAYFILSHFSSGPHEVWAHASESLKAQVIPKLASGELQGCFGLSEPDAGSDSWMMKTTATRNGDGWVINGSKQWTSWSPTADFVMVYAVTDKERVAARKGGITCFYVPTSTPGYKLESVIKIFGQLGGDEGILSFTDVQIPDEYRVGELHEGFKLAMLGVRHGRLANSGRAIGQSRWAMDKAIAYAKVRKTFGHFLSEHQTIQNYLAENAIKLYAARAMALDCAAKADEGRDVRDEVSMVKVFCTRAALEIIDRCMQIHGGMGVVNETRLFEAWQVARLNHITEGTNEIHLRTLSRNLLAGRVDLAFG